MSQINIKEKEGDKKKEKSSIELSEFVVDSPIVQDKATRQVQFYENTRFGDVSGIVDKVLTDKTDGQLTGKSFVQIKNKIVQSTWKNMIQVRMSNAKDRVLARINELNPINTFENILTSLYEIKNKSVLDKEDKTYLEELLPSIPVGYPTVFNAVQIYSNIKNRTESKSNFKFREKYPSEYPTLQALRRKLFHLDYDTSLVKESEYKPSTATDPDATYYTFPLKENFDIEELVYMAEINSNMQESSWKDYIPFKDINPKGAVAQAWYQDRVANMLGLVDLQHFKLGMGEGDKGKYVSFYDKYDVDIPFIDKDINEYLLPFEIYDRVYYTEDEQGYKTIMKD